jgi:hypothetical protein
MLVPVRSCDFRLEKVKSCYFMLDQFVRFGHVISG